MYYAPPDSPFVGDLRRETVLARFRPHITAMLDALDGKPGQIDGRLVTAQNAPSGRMVRIAVALERDVAHPLNVEFTAVRQDDGYQVTWVGPWESVGSLRFGADRRRRA